MEKEYTGFSLFSSSGQKDTHIRVKAVSSGDEVSLGEYHILPIESEHDRGGGSLVYLIENHGKCLFYGTDHDEMTPGIWRLLQGKKIDIAVLDHTYGKGVNAGGHLDAGQVAQIAARMRDTSMLKYSGNVYATHISHEGNPLHEVMEKQASEAQYSIAFDGLVLDV